MKRERFAVEQIVAVLKQAEAGLPAVEVCREAGIYRASLLSMEEAVRRTGDLIEVRHLKQVQEENSMKEPGGRAAQNTRGLGGVALPPGTVRC